MNQKRLQPPSHDALKSSMFFSYPEKPHDIFVLLARISLLVCLVTSVFLVLYTSFTAQPHWLRPPSPARPGPPPSGQTNLSHILFCLGGSTATWHARSVYSSLWWTPNVTRGFVWLDEKPNATNPENSGSGPAPVRVSSPEWTRFRYSSSRSAVRIARIILEGFKLRLPNVRWFVMGDDDTVFFSDNLVSVLARHDHNQMWYIGGDSESVEQDVMHSYGMGFGGGGFAVSYPLAERLVNILDGCLDRYYYFYGSDQRIWACISEIGVTLSRHRGFHQFDIRGNPYGLLSAHSIAPLVSLHHLDYVDPIFPSQTQIESLKALIRAYRVDPNRILQQSICYDHKRKWSISVAWGYTIQLYPLLLPAFELQTPLQTFKTWRSWKDGPFTFNTRPVKADPCLKPVVYFLERVQEVGKSGSLTSYKRFEAKPGKKCDRTAYVRAMAVDRITVSSMKMDPEYWNQAPRRQCCEIMNNGSKKNSSMLIRIRKCRAWETVNT